MTDNVAEVVDDCIAVLPADETIFQRDATLVRVVLPADPSAAARIVPLTKASARAVLQQLAEFRVVMAAGTACKPLKPDVIDALLERGVYPGIPVIDRIVETPLVTKDLDVVSADGFHEPSGVYVSMRRSYPAVPPVVSQADALAAAASVMGHFADFPFAGDADRSVVLGTMLTVVAREAIDGVTPAVSIDAPTAGSGKTLLSDGLSICATGRHVPRTAAPKNSDEERRSIMAVALSGPPIMLLDNLHRPFGGENYDPLVTAGEWSDRPTRGAESRSLPWRTVILVTGNNLQLTGDMARRVLPIRLVPAQERPEERTDIRDPRLLATLKQKHPAILVDLLTIIEGWKQAGRPSAQLTPWGSFEAWGDLVRNVVVWLGMPDPVAARPRVSKMGDSADAARRQLLLGLKKLSDSRGGSFMSKDVVVAANSDPDLSEALTVLLPRQNGNEEQATAIGSLLAKHRDRIFGGLALREAGTRQNTKLWAVDGEPESPPVVLVAETDSSATPEDDDIDWATFEG